MIILYIAGVVLSLGLNLFVVVVVASKRKCVSYFDLLMLSLSISDILQTGVGYSTEIYALATSSTISKDACKVAGFTVTFLALVSISHLVGISIQRTLVLRYPWKARKWIRRSSMSLFIIIPSWTWGLVWALMPLFGWSSYKREQNAHHRCSVDLSNTSRNVQSYGYALLAFCFFLPVVGIGTSSTLTIIEMKKMTRTGTFLGLENHSKRRSREIRQTVMAFVLVTVFLISWSPYAACVFMITFNGKVDDTLLTFSALFAKASVLYNPVIYFTFLKEFRHRCFYILGCRSKSSKSEQTTMSAVSVRNSCLTRNFEDLTETRL